MGHGADDDPESVLVSARGARPTHRERRDLGRRLHRESEAGILVQRVVLQRQRFPGTDDVGRVRQLALGAQEQDGPSSHPRGGRRRLAPLGRDGALHRDVWWGGDASGPRAADYFFVPKYGLHQDLGKRLAAFLGSEAAQEEQVKQGGHIATAAGVPASAYPTVDARVAGLLQGKVVLSDLDDTIGNPFQGKFWSELQKLWATPAQWQTILAEIQAAAVAQP